jgi:hypothetical protein
MPKELINEHSEEEQKVLSDTEKYRNQINVEKVCDGCLHLDFDDHEEIPKVY